MLSSSVVAWPILHVSTCEIRLCYKSDHLQVDGIKAAQADSLQLQRPQMFLITDPLVDLKEGWIQHCISVFWLDLEGGGLSL